MADNSGEIQNFDSSMWADAGATPATGYNYFIDAKPVDTDTVLQVVTDSRNNLESLAQSVAYSAVPSWNYSVVEGTGDAEEPQYVYYKKGATWIRGTMTYSSGSITQAAWHRSTDSGSNWDAMGTQSVSYDGDGNVSTVTWS